MVRFEMRRLWDLYYYDFVYYNWCWKVNKIEGYYVFFMGWEFNISLKYFVIFYGILVYSWRFFMCILVNDFVVG